MRYSEWKSMAGGSSMGDRVKEKTQKIIKEYQAPTLPDDVVKKIDAIIKKAEEREAKKS
jgi:trimethylamine:corrinoid methyltransferase-like protein